MSNYLDSRSELSFDGRGMDISAGHMDGNTTGDPLAWEMNIQMRHAVLPVTLFVAMEIVIGFWGNMLVLYVFLCRYHVCNFRYFVVCLASVDLMATLTTMPGEMVTQLYWYVYPVPIYCKIKSFCNIFTVFAEAMCLLLIAVDRYKKICRPFGIQIKPRVAKVLCVLILVTAFVCAFPVPFLWGTNTHEKEYNNQMINVTVCEKDEQFVNTNYPIGYVISIQTLIACCLVVMVILYFFVAKELLLRRSNTRQAGLAELRKAQQARDEADDGAATALCRHDPPDKQERHDEAEAGHLSEISLQDTSKLISLADSNTANYSREISTDPNTSATTAALDITSESTINSLPTDNGGSTDPTQPSERNKTAARVRRKTLIMFILTAVFVVTTILYLILLTLIAHTDDILKSMSDSGKTVYFFFLRSVFINHVINPFVYGVLDTQFTCQVKELQRKFLSASGLRRET